MNNFNPVTAEQQAEAQRRLEEAEDAEFDYELYRNHPIQSADHNAMPLFMDARNVRRQLADEDDTEATCVDIEALKHMDDEFDPEDEAEVLKRQGNQAFSMGYEYRLAALKLFTKAIKLPVKDHKKRSVYFANRAAVNLMGENYGNCVSDCKHAIRLDPDNIKAYYRAAKANFALKKWALTAEFVDAGLAVDPTNAPLLEIRTAVNEALDKQRVVDAAQRDKAAKAKAAQNASTQRLFDLLAANDVKIGAPNATVPLADAFGTHPESGELTSRVVFLYDEHAQSDTIQAMPISTTFREQLDNMFPPNGAEAPWDVDHKYTLNQLELYCVLNQTTQLTYDADKQSVTRMERAGKPKWARVDLALSLHQLFQRQNYIVPGVVTLYCVVRGTVHATKLLSLDPEEMA